MSNRVEDKIAQYLAGKDPIASRESVQEADLAFRQFQARRDAAVSAKRKKRTLRWAAAISAAACITLLIGLLGTRRTSAPSLPFVASTTAGETTAVTLPDGTLVWLNASSSLRCSPDFGTGNRDAFLEGEAYFEVVHNEALPMAIHTGSTTTTVLGTRFSLREYPEDQEVTLLLHEGHVAFCGAAGSRLELSKGQSARLDKVSGEMTFAQYDTDAPASWRDGLLIFEDCTLERICRDLSNAYGVCVRVTDESLLDLRFSATFNIRTQQLSDALEALSLTRHISFRMTEGGAEVF